MIIEEHRERQLPISISSEKGVSLGPQLGRLYRRRGRTRTPYSRTRRVVEITSIFKVDGLKRHGVSEVLGPNSTTIPVRVALKDTEFVSGFSDKIWLDGMTVETIIVEITFLRHC